MIHRMEALACMGSCSKTSDGYTHRAFTISKHFLYNGDDGVKSRKTRFVYLLRTSNHFVLLFGTVTTSFAFAVLTSDRAMEEEARR